MPAVKHTHKYTVTKQEQGTHFNSDGTTHKVWTVHVQHEDGTTGTVEMPDAYYTAKNVHNAIADQAHAVHEVGNLPASLSNPMPAPEVVE